MPDLVEGDILSEGKDEISNDLVGVSPVFRRALMVARSVASRKSTVMLHGETGAGKEMIAREIHQHSTRAIGPFIPVDCSALSDTLFESQLFGHRRGAFTGAVRDSIGFIRAADQGTLFLDEIGELSLPLQAKLLRVIQERKVIPLGDTVAHPVNVRIITATHRDLPAMVRAGQFRQDLFFRLNVITLTVPPLRQRPEDILPLARFFLATQAELYCEDRRELSPAAAKVLVQYNWPGNVRELANVMEHVHVLAKGSSVDVADLPERLRQQAESAGSITTDLDLDAIETRAIHEAMRRTQNNKSAAARLLGIHVQKLNRRLTRSRGK